MDRRKGELSRKLIDADWPHQVAVTAETCRGDGYLTTHFFCTELSLCPRRWHYRREDRDYVVFCGPGARGAVPEKVWRRGGQPENAMNRRAAS